MKKSKHNAYYDHFEALCQQSFQVLRDGTWAAVRETDLTVGDVIQCTLESPKIPADIAVIYVDDEVAVDESSLTGEATPVPKHPISTCAAKTTLVKGAFTGIVTKVGSETLVGRIPLYALRTDKSLPKELMRALQEKNVFARNSVFLEPMKKLTHTLILDVEGVESHPERWKAIVASFKALGVEEDRIRAISTAIELNPTRFVTSSEVLSGMIKDSPFQAAMIVDFSESLAIYKSRPPVIHDLINHLRQNGKVVMTIGNSSGEAPLLLASDVSIVSNKANHIAKEASDLIYLGDDASVIVELNKVNRLYGTIHLEKPVPGRTERSWDSQLMTGEEKIEF